MKTLQQVKQKMDFSEDSIYVGIDVHKKQWSVFIMSDYKEHKGFVQPPDPRALANYLRKNFPGATYYSTYEAGFSGFWIDEALKKEGINNIVVNPADVPTTDKEKKTKSDRVDSRKLCKKLRDKDLEAIFVPERYQLEDRELVRLRTKLVRDVRRCKGRIKSMLNFYGINHSFTGWTKAFFTWLQELHLVYSNGTFTLHALVEELQSIEDLKKKVGRQIRSGIVKNERYAKLIGLLCRIPGIGLIGAITILTELGNMKRFRNCDHLCSYVGLVPTLYSSDETEYVGNLTPRGNTYVLPILIECAWAAVGKDPALMNAYHQLCKRMKGQDAIIRIARKLLRRIRHVLIHETPYELNTVSQCMQLSR
ncbi:MAG: IS110 family transposase [Bacteroidia bacterium]|nr:IS110 family transposase [Bacteroidia bacterium]